MLSTSNRLIRAIILFAPLVIGGAALLLHGPIPQDPTYHEFADRRTIGGIPHFGDVVSNAAFVLAGAAGLLFLASPRSARAFRDPRERTPWALFFAGVLSTGFG